MTMTEDKARKLAEKIVEDKLAPIAMASYLATLSMGSSIFRAQWRDTAIDRLTAILMEDNHDTQS